MKEEEQPACRRGDDDDEENKKSEDAWNVGMQSAWQEQCERWKRMNTEKLKSEQIKKMRVEVASLAETVSKDRQDILANAIDNPDNPACPARPQENNQ